MSAAHGKKAAIAACIVAVPIAILAAWKPAMEAWHLHRLRDETREDEERFSAARALVALECYRALPEMATFIGVHAIFETGTLWDILEPLNHPAAWPYWLETQGSKCADARSWAWEQIAHTGREDAETLAAFQRALADENAPVSDAAITVGTFALGSRAVEASVQYLARARPESVPPTIRNILALGPLALEAEGSLRQALMGQPRLSDDSAWHELVAWIEELGMDALPDIERALGSSEPEVQFLAAVELLKRAPGQRGVVLAWKTLASGSAWDHEALLKELTALARRNPAALDPRFVPDGAASWLFRAIEPLGAISIPILFRALAVSSPDIHERAWNWLSILFISAKAFLTSLPDSSPERVAELISALDHAPDESTLDVLEELTELGPAAREAAPALERLILAEELEIPLNDATRALATVDPERQVPSRFITEYLRARDKDPLRDLPTLMALGPRAANAVPTMLTLMDESEWTELYILALRNIGWPAWIDHAGPPGSDLWKRVVDLLANETLDARAIPILRSILQTEETVPDWIWPAIQKMGIEASQLIPDVVKLANCGPVLSSDGMPGWPLDSEATETLGFLGRDAVPALTERLNHWDGQCIAMVLDALTRIGADAAEAVPSILTHLRRRPAPTQVKAAKALERIGAAAVPGLLEALADPSEDVRCLAAHALGRIGPAADTTRAALRARLEDPSSLVRRTAERALARLGGE